MLHSANCMRNANGGRCTCGQDSPLPPNRVPIVFPPEPGTSPMMSIPPDKRGSSYALAATFVGFAASSALGIGNALHRTLAVLACAALAYLIGLRTETRRK